MDLINRVSYVFQRREEEAEDCEISHTEETNDS